MPAGPSGVVVLHAQTVIYVLIVVSAIIIGARIYLRLAIQKQRLVTADWLRISAWCTAFVTGFFDILSVTKPEEACKYTSTLLMFQINWVLHFVGSIAQLWCSLDVYIGLVICCIPALRPYLHRKGVNYNIQESGRPSKSGHAIRRTGQSGFEEIVEGPGLRGDGRDDSWSASHSCEITAELSDKKENGSDIELVSIEISKSSV
ncbi:integral membrane protein [Fusarium denticulatum]|uniref:Integral membrane protein n=1 Tax=Fusarium denticulatum TaxID=48507 RepID=A0A8H5XJG8_9HYPO|nr:integral membrane protein [Fusarium denticulatum]